MGDESISTVVGGLLGELEKTAKDIYLLEWKGGKVPKGVILPTGDTITWTQNGVVNGENGKMIGTYQRLVEFGGESQDEQKMLVWMLPEEK